VRGRGEDEHEEESEEPRHGHRGATMPPPPGSDPRPQRPSDRVRVVSGWSSRLSACSCANESSRAAWSARSRSRTSCSWREISSCSCPRSAASRDRRSTAGTVEQSRSARPASATIVSQPGSGCRAEPDGGRSTGAVVALLDRRPRRAYIVRTSASPRDEASAARDRRLPPRPLHRSGARPSCGPTARGGRCACLLRSSVRCDFVPPRSASADRCSAPSACCPRS